MTRELSKTEKALRLIVKEGITAKEAAERVGISPAAVSKGRLWPSKAAQNVRKLCEMENEIEALRSELATLTRQRDLAVEALKNIKSNLMHHRRFGTDTLQAWKNAAVNAERDAEEAVASVKGGAA